MPTKHETIFMRVAKALGDRKWDDFEALLTEDYVEEYPQSGETFHGRKNARAVREQYPGGLPPGGLDVSDARIASPEARWVRTPAFTFVRAEGSGNVGTAAFKAGYPDGSVWWIVLFYELRGDLIAKGTFFFAPFFEAPEWRKPYVERESAGA
jgi:SnoaL-like protein